eukprot:2678541-Ditylum_brightwellii.AAC.1
MKIRGDAKSHERKKKLRHSRPKQRHREDTAAQGRRSKELKDGMTPLKMKVIHWKNERKAVVDKDKNTGGSTKKEKNKNKCNIPLPTET